ncbi:MAG: hypothetical protein WKF58_20460 [Ilumatobacteraceae bacterium]
MPLDLPVSNPIIGRTNELERLAALDGTRRDVAACVRRPAVG